MYKHRIIKFWTTLGIASLLIAPMVLSKDNINVQASRYHHSRITRFYKMRHRHVRHHAKAIKHHKHSIKYLRYKNRKKRYKHVIRNKKHKYIYKHHKRIRRLYKYKSKSRHKYHRVHRSHRHKKIRIINQISNKHHKKHLRRNRIKNHKVANRIYNNESTNENTSINNDAKPQITPTLPDIPQQPTVNTNNSDNILHNNVNPINEPSNTINNTHTEPQISPHKTKLNPDKPAKPHFHKIVAPTWSPTDDSSSSYHQPDSGTYYGNENSMEQQIKNQTLSDINADRESNGLSPLKTDTDLDHYAYNRAQDLTTDYSHNGDTGIVDNTYVNENIADASLGEETQEGSPKLYNAHNGTDIANQCNDAMFNYDQDEGNGHRDNILDPTAFAVGVGVSQKDGTYYIAEDFEHTDHD